MNLKLGAHLVALAGAAMVGYGILFLVRNFTAFIELGLTPELVGGTPELIALAIVLPIHHVYGLATPGHVGPVYLAMALLAAGALLAKRGV